MSTVERPVTQIVETAVKRASAKGARCPMAVAAGSESSSVNSVISATKMRTAKRAGDDVVSERMSSYNRLKNRRIPKRENGLTGCAPPSRPPVDCASLAPDAASAPNLSHGTPRGARLI